MSGSSLCNQGFINLSVTDAPIDDVAAVVVQFTGVEIQSEVGGRLQFDFEEPRQIDLLALHGGGSDLLLAQEPLPSGHYNWIRLKVEADSDKPDSYVMLADGSEHPLTIPSGDQTGLKLNNGFNVPAGATASFTIDFDLRKSVHEPSPKSSNEYLLKPVLHMVDNAEVGSIAGSVDPGFICEPNGPVCAIYVFEGRDVTPDDIDGTETFPLTTARVELDPITGEYTYRAAFLKSGDYTLVFTCQAANDDPETDYLINFGETANVAVLSGVETTYDFLP